MSRVLVENDTEGLELSCRYCTVGVAKHIVKDGKTKFGLCDTHKQAYNITKDEVAYTIDELRKQKADGSMETDAEVSARMNL